MGGCPVTRSYSLGITHRQLFNGAAREACDESSILLFSSPGVPVLRQRHHSLDSGGNQVTERHVIEFILDTRIARNSRQEGEHVFYEGTIASNGAPVVWVSGLKHVNVRRYVYERAHGPLAEGMQVFGTCEHKNCLALEHLVAIYRPSSRARHR